MEKFFEEILKSDDDEDNNDKHEKVVKQVKEPSTQKNISSSSSSLDKFIDKLYMYDMIKHDTRHYGNKVEFITSLYNSSHNTSISTSEFITRLDKYFTYMFEMKDEDEFFRKNEYTSTEKHNPHDVEELVDVITLTVSEEMKMFVESSPFYHLSIEQISPNEWKLYIEIQNEHGRQEGVEIFVSLYKHEKNKYSFLITEINRTN